MNRQTRTRRYGAGTRDDPEIVDEREAVTGDFEEEVGLEPKRGLPAVRNPDVPRQIERAGVERIGLDIGPIRGWWVDFQSRNKTTTTWIQMVDDTREALMRRLRAELEAEYQEYVEELRHKLKMTEITHAADEFRLSLDKRMRQALEAFRVKSEIYVAGRKVIEDLSAGDPKLAAELERRFFEDMNYELRSYTGRIDQVDDGRKK